MSGILSARHRHGWLRTLAATTVFGWLGGCGGNPDDAEAAVRAWVESGIEAAENEARRDLVEMMSPAYTDGRGNSRDDVDKMLRLYFLRADNIALLSHIDDVRIIGEDFAEVDMTLGMAGATDSALGISADAYSFNFELEKVDGDWILISARWAEMGRELH